MKVGIHQHVFTESLNTKNLDYLNIIRDIGFDSIDINVRNLDTATAKIIKRRADKLDLIIKGGGSLPYDKELLSENKDKRIEAIAYMKCLVETVIELGSDFYGGVIYGPLGRFTGLGPTDMELEFSAEALREVARFAKKYGIRLGIEPVNRYESYILNTIKASLHHLKKVNEENVGLLIDTFHMNIEEEDFYQSILQAKDKIFHIHVNESDRGTPGKGHINWNKVFRAIRDIEYKGVLAIESFVGSKVDIASVICIWRKLAESPDALARDGYKFIKKMSEKYIV